MNEVEQILAQRKEQYGEFKDVASMSANACRELMINDALRGRHPSEWVALVMIVNKIARLINGDISHKDSWDDIAGYASLISKQLANKTLLITEAKK